MPESGDSGLTRPPLSHRLGTPAVLAALVAALGLAASGALSGDSPEPAGPPSDARQAHAAAETEPVPSAGDAADDPAIWVDRGRPARSTVIGTDKRGGIAVYDLAGRELQYRRDGSLNNVDLRGGLPLRGSAPGTLVAATNRTFDTISLYRVDPRTRKLRVVDLRAMVLDFEVFGLCMYRRAGRGRYGVFITGRHDGHVEHRTFRARPDGSVVAKRVHRTVELGGIAEGCVVDEQSGHAYFSEERRGIWSVPIGPGGEKRRRLVAGAGEGRPLVPDLEGLAIARFEGETQLVASSQGSDSFVVYALDGRRAARLYSFVVADGEIDGASDTDGIEITKHGLGRRFPHGMLVVQDGTNDRGRQNFKLVPLCRDAVAC